MPTKDFEANYNKVKAKLTGLSSSASASKSLMVKNKGLIAEVYERDDEEVSSDDNEMVEHKPERMPTKYFEANYNKVKAKLTGLSSSVSASKSLMVKNKGLIAEVYERDDEEVSSDDNEMVEVKVLMALADENVDVSKECARNGEYMKIYMRKCDIRKPIWYLDSGCSRHMTGVKSYLHKNEEQPRPK
nr:retrovirus-related Pol polyprotein from transposon TNT 1-94 [Tanacetum cinerariifolium]